MARQVLALLSLPLVLFAEGLEQEPSSPRAKRLREEAHALWTPHAEMPEKLTRGEALDPEEAKKALADIEEAVLKFERALQIEWHTETNRVLAEVVRAWFKIRGALPPPAEGEPDGDRKRELRDARRFIMDHAKARKYESQFRRCDRCDGRKDLSSQFGDKTPCPRCQRLGHLPVEKTILEAHWLAYSPLHRAHGRNLGAMDQKLRLAAQNQKRLAPFIRSAGIDGKVEDHGLYVTVKLKEKVYEEPGSRKTDKAENEYVLFNVGKIWYVYDPKADRELFSLPEPEENEKTE